MTDAHRSALVVEVGARIRAARTARDLSQRELAERLGVTQTAVSNWESGKRAVTVDSLIDLARVLRVDAAVLVPDEPPTAPEREPLTDAERAAAALFARGCIHEPGEACTECEARAREFVAAVAPAIIAACPDCVRSEAELLGVAAVVNVVRSGYSPFAAPMIEKGSLSWEVAEAISRGRPRGLAGAAGCT